MAYFQPTHTYVFLLAIIACHQILLTEGRQLKSMKKQDFNTIMEGSDLGQQVKTLGDIPSADHYVASKKKTFPPSPTQTLGFGNLEAGNVDDFRPTTPGNSPGAGHSFEEHNVDVEPEALGKGSTIGSSLAGNTDDFRPTVPGHSPGVGHSLQAKKTEPNA
ncbi:hypothetical protein LguiA_017542 [Lonicera macranthoides]